MKKSALVVGIICVFFIFIGATKGDKPGPEVAYLPSHFKYEKKVPLSFDIIKGPYIAITGLKKKSITTTVHIPSVINKIPVRAVEKNAFKGMNLIEVVIPENVIAILDYAFAYNSLSKVIIAESVAWIGAFAFANNSLTEIFIPKGVSHIVFSAFESNQISKVTFSEAGAIELIGNRAFAKNKLTAVILPNFKRNENIQRYGNNSKLGSDSFADNDLKEPVIIPESVQDIIINLTSFSIRGVITGSGKNQTITVISDSHEIPREIAIPSYVYGIPVTKITTGYPSYTGTKYGFFAGKSGYTMSGRNTANRKRLETLTLPENLQEIEMGSFAFCDITRVVAPNRNVQNIWDEYLKKQNEADELVYRREFNEQADRMRQAAEDLRRMQGRF
jgi:hypothetical protein